MAKDRICKNSQTLAGEALSLIKNGIIELIGEDTVPELAKTLPLQLRTTFMCGSIPFVPEYLNRLNRVIVIEDNVSKKPKIPTGP